MALPSALPSLMLGWTGDVQSRNFGVWVLERPSPSQLRIFEDASFPYQSEACFAPPELMEKAGANFYSNIRDSATVQAWLYSDPPPLLIGFGQGQDSAVWVLRHPTGNQLQLFRDAGFPIGERRFTADSDLLRAAGAKLHANKDLVPEVVSILFTPPSAEEPYQHSLFGWPEAGGVWALLRPTEEQIAVLERNGYDFHNDFHNDKTQHCHSALLKNAGAEFYPDPTVIKQEIEHVFPNFELGLTGQRGGKAPENRVPYIPRHQGGFTIFHSSLAHLPASSRP